MRARLTEALLRPVDAAGLAVFRVALGLVLAAGAARALLSGWIPRLYHEPAFFFTWPGLDFVRPLPYPLMHVVYGALVGLGLAIAAGRWTRAAAGLFFALFSYTQLVDITNYLNHHYLVSLLCLLLAVLPLGGRTVPAWALYLLRLQVGLVYFYAGLAKLGGDWLLAGQPLGTWLAARTHTPLVGPHLDEPLVALAVSWAGFLFDTTIVLWLSWRRTRVPAYLALVGFHTVTGYWFNLGMFPFIMSAAALVFFAPDWPRRWLRRPAPSPDPVRAPGRVAAALLAAYCAFQALVPLRHLLYPGDVLWTEEGMRFAWKVMVREKHGSVTFHVRSPEAGWAVQVSPRQYLTSKQEREMAGQPDLILALAKHVAADFRARGLGGVEVRAEALVSLNRRAAAPLVDPTRDLAREEDGLAPKTWILPGGRP
jgi:vitamin K-dependent gamma-carboxylase